MSRALSPCPSGARSFWLATASAIAFTSVPALAQAAPDRPAAEQKQGDPAVPPVVPTLSADAPLPDGRSEEHTSELQSLMRISYADFCLKKKNTNKKKDQH